MNMNDYYDVNKRLEMDSEVHKEETIHYYQLKEILKKYIIQEGLTSSTISNLMFLFGAIIIELRNEQVNSTEKEATNNERI